MKASMWALSSATELNDAPASDLPVRMENQISTWLSQEACVGVKWKWTFRWRLSHWSRLGLWVLRLSRMTDVAARVLREEAVHEVEELDAAPAVVVAAAHLAGGDIEGGEERGCAMSRVVVALPGQRPPVGQLQIALRAFERLDRRLLVDRQHEGAARWIEIEPDNLRRLGGERGIVTLAPRFARGQIDLLLPQEAPDVLHVDIAQARGNQRSAPAPVTRRHRGIKDRQDAFAGRRRVLGLRAPVAGLAQPSEPRRGIAHPPLRRGTGRAPDRPADRRRRHTARRQQHDPRPLAQPVLRLRRARQAFQPGPLFFRQDDRGRFRDASCHASLNHDSRFRNSGY